MRQTFHYYYSDSILNKKKILCLYECRLQSFLALKFDG